MPNRPGLKLASLTAIADGVVRINRRDVGLRGPVAGPEERVVDLPRRDEMLDLLEPRERPGAEGLLRQLDAGEHLEQLARAPLGVPRAGERRACSSRIFSKDTR